MYFRLNICLMIFLYLLNQVPFAENELCKTYTMWSLFLNHFNPVSSVSQLYLPLPKITVIN